MYPDHTRYYLGFNLVPGIGPVRLSRLIARCGSVEAAWQADAASLAAAGIEPKFSAALRTARANLDLDVELARADQAEVTLLTLEDAAYPALLREAPAAPPLLYLRGQLPPAEDWAIAVVGTRVPTTYGREVTYRLAGDLARAGICVVSGLALGVDTLAHEAALEVGGRTLAVLGSGVDLPTPERNRHLGERIVTQGGALLSDYPLGTPPAAANFPPRNRIISGLCRATLVIEAGERSGALITVGFALEQGREVFAVPGSIFSRQSAGCHRLLRDGAGLARSADDLLADLDLNAVAVQREARAAIPDDPLEAAVLACVSATPCHIDELGQRAGMTAATVAAALALLELKGLVRQPAPLLYVLAR